MAIERLLAQERISQDPTIMVSKPAIKNTRIPIERVLAHLANRPDLDGLFTVIPN
jgi:uncharacterized protein (DUF433 family)